jgi:hypothetical protein
MKHPQNQRPVKQKRLMAIGLSILIGLGGCQASEENVVNNGGSVQNSQSDLPAGEAKEIPEQANNTGNWTVVKSWEGTSLKSTEPFTITSSKWRIKWECSSISEEPSGQIFAIEADRPGGDGSEVEIAANVVNQKSAKDVSYIYKSGEFFLKVINSNNRWKITVEEEK